MKHLIFKDYESLSQAAAEHMLAKVKSKPDAVICLATGTTPTRCYELLSRLNTEDKQEFNQVSIVKLDEWGGLADSDPSTCEYYLRKHIVVPLQIREEKYISFRGSASDSNRECQRIQDKLSEIGRIDLCVLGLGVNGHLGFNEPADSLLPNVHVAELAEQTQKHSMIHAAPRKPEYGYTLGMADLLQSEEIMILVSGNHKAFQLRRLLSKNIDTRFPASLLWLHHNVTLFSDI